jgi:hypothetical protein
MFSFGRIQLRRFFLSLVLSFLISLLLFLTGSAYSAQMTLAWDPNNEPGVAGYRIYYSLLRRQCSSSVDAGNRTSYTLSSLEDGKTYYLAATAYDQYGDESDFSDEAIFNVPPFDKRHSC